MLGTGLAGNMEIMGKQNKLSKGWGHNTEVEPPGHWHKPLSISVLSEFEDQQGGSWPSRMNTGRVAGNEVRKVSRDRWWRAF